MKKGAAVLMAIVAAVAVIGIVLVFNGGSLTGAQVIEDRTVVCTGCVDSPSIQQHACSGDSTRSQANLANWLRARDRDGCTCNLDQCITRIVSAESNSFANVCCDCLDAKAINSPTCKTKCQSSFSTRRLPAWPVPLRTISDTDSPINEDGNGISFECESVDGTLAQLALFQWLERDFLARDQQSCAQCVTTCAPTCTSQADCKSQLGEDATCSGIPSNFGRTFPEQTGRCILVCNTDFPGCDGGSSLSVCVQQLFGSDDDGGDDGVCCPVGGPQPTPSPTFPPEETPTPTPTPECVTFAVQTPSHPATDCDNFGAADDECNGGQCGSITGNGFAKCLTCNPEDTIPCLKDGTCNSAFDCGSSACVVNQCQCVCVDGTACSGSNACGGLNVCENKDENGVGTCNCPRPTPTATAIPTATPTPTATAIPTA